MKCPNINNLQAVINFNSIVELFNGKPLTIEEFKDTELRNLRDGNDALSMNIAYAIWNLKGETDIPLDKVSILEDIKQNFNIIQENVDTKYQYSEEGLSAIEFNYMNLRGDKHLNKLSKVIFNKLKEHKINFKFSKDELVLNEEEVGELEGQVLLDLNNNVVVFVNPAFDNRKEAALHELTHVLTIAALHSPINEIENLFKGKITTLLKEARTKITVDNIIIEEALSDEMEFVAYSLSNKEFQQRLNDTIHESRSLLDRLIEFIGDLLGIDYKKGSLLEQVVKSTGYFLHNNDFIDTEKRIKAYLENAYYFPAKRGVTHSKESFEHANEIVNDIENFDEEVSVKYEDYDMYDEPMLDATAKRIITKATIEIQSRIDFAYLSIGRNPAKKEAILESINSLKEAKKGIAKSKLIKDVVDTVDNVLESLRPLLFEGNSINATDIAQANADIEMSEILLNEILEVESVNSGIITYRLQTPIITAKAEFLKNIINEYKDKIMTLNYSLLQNKVKDKLGKYVSLEDMKKIEDISFLWSLSMDTSRMDNKLVAYLSTLLKDVNRNVMTEYEQSIGVELENLLKEIGYYKNKKKFNDAMLQKDAKGNLTKNLVDAYSQSYYDYLSNMKNKLNKLNKVEKPIDKKTKKRLFSDLLSNIEIPDYSVILGNDETAKEEEIKKLEKKYGKEVVERLINDIDKKIASYLKAKEAVGTSREALHQAGKEGFRTSEETALKAEAWDRLNNPLKIYENLIKGYTDSIVFTTFKRYIAFIPIKEIGGNKSEWYDKDYETIQNNPDTYGRLYNFISDNLDVLKDFYPPNITAKLNHNYLPEVYKNIIESIQDEGVVGVVTGTSLLDRFFKSLSEEDSNVDTSLRDSKGKLLKSVPMKFAKDNVGILRASLNKAENELENSIKLYEGYLNQGIVEKELDEQLRSTIEKNQETHDKLKKAYEMSYDKKSIDVVKAFRMFAFGAINYKRKSAVEDVINLGLEVMEEASAITTNASGKKITDRLGRLVNVKDGKLNITAQLEHERDAILYSITRNTKEKKAIEIGLTEESRKQLRSVKKQLKEIKLKLLRNEITQEEYEESTALLNSEKEGIADKSYLAPSKGFDKILNATYLTTLGWNFTSALNNTLYGLIANSIEASSGRFFNEKEYKQALKLTSNTMKKSVIGKDNRTSKKIRNLMLNYGVMYDLMEDASGTAKIQEYNKKLGLISPMEINRRAEYLNQSSLLVSTLLHTKVETTIGQEISLWEAYDDNGKMRDDIIGKEEWIPLFDAEQSNKFTKRRNSVIQLIKRTHGNYDPSSPMRAKRYMIGRSLMALRSWVAEGVATRFEAFKEDEQLGDYVKGRYRTIKDLGVRNSIYIIKDILLRKAISNKDLENLSDEDRVDIENMRRNVKELKWYLLMAAIMILANLGFDDEEEKTAGYKKLYKTINRLSDDMSLYTNPKAILDLYNQPSPMFKLLSDVANIPFIINKYVTSDNKRYDEEYLLKGIFRPVPGLSSLTKWL